MSSVPHELVARTQYEVVVEGETFRGFPAGSGLEVSPEPSCRREQLWIGVPCGSVTLAGTVTSGALQTTVSVPVLLSSLPHELVTLTQYEVVTRGVTETFAPGVSGVLVFPELP